MFDNIRINPTMFLLGQQLGSNCNCVLSLSYRGFRSQVAIGAKKWALLDQLRRLNCSNFPRMHVPESKFLRAIRGCILFFPIRKFSKVTRQKLIQLEKSLKVAEDEKKKATERGCVSIAELHNIAIYLCTLDYDLMSLCLHLVPETDQFLQQSYCRQIAIILYEFLDDYPHLTGKKLRSIINQLPQAQQNLAALNAVGVSVREFRVRNEVQLKLFRNFVGAHRDLDGQKQLEIIRQIDVNEVRTIAYEVDLFVTRVVRLLTSILSEIGYSWLTVREISNKMESEKQSKLTN